MAQADYIISNQTFPNTRADINNHLSAIATNNSGTSAPTTQYAGQFWIDTTSSTWTLYIHDGSDDIAFATIDTSANTVNFTDSALDVVTDTTPQLGGNLDTNGNNIDFGDNDKARFGASQDLEIFHNGSNSYISDNGTGDLYIRGSADIRLTNPSATENYAIFNNDGAVDLYYDNSKKFETTSTGATVTGTMNATQFVGGGLNAFKNIIINGDMSIAQRGTSTSSITGGAYHTLDRFKTFVNNTAGTWTQSQDTTVPTGQGFAKSLKMDCTTAKGSLSASDILSVQQRFEGQNLQYLKKGTSSAESLTASFWVRSNKTGTYIAELEDRDNTRYVSQSYTISSADTWEKKTVTFPGDTSGAFTNDNGESLRLNFWLGGGATWTSGTLGTTWHTTSANRAVGQVNLADSTSNEWYITGVQLEAGQTASEFEFLPHDVIKRRCQRYFQILGHFVGYALTNTTTVNGQASFLEMRSAPSLSQTDVITVSDDVIAGFTQSAGGISLFASNGVDNNFGNIQVRSVSGLTSYNNYSIIPTSAGRLTLDAEL